MRINPDDLRKTERDMDATKALFGQDLGDAVLSHPRFVAVPHAMGRQPVLVRQPAGKRGIIGGLLPAAWAVLVLRLMGDGRSVEAQPDRASAAWAVTSAIY